MNRLFRNIVFLLLFVPLQALPRATELRRELLDPSSEKIFVVAHRGDWRHAPENSLQAIRNSIKMGVDMVEIDIRKTKDGELILLHDETLNRTTTGKGNPADFTLAELKKLYLKNGAGHKTRHQIPTLEEALTVAKGQILINIDKGLDYFNEVLALLEKTGTTEQVILKSGSRYAEVKKLYPDLFDKVLFMPVVNMNSSDAATMIKEYRENVSPVAFELTFEAEFPALYQYAEQIRTGGAKVFVNSLWPELCAGRDDDKAVEEEMPDETWGWIIRFGARLIQTDRPEELISYVSNYEYNPRSIYVDCNASLSGSGTKAEPYNKLETAIATARSGDSLFLTAGSYIPDDTEENRKATFRLSKSLFISGGYDKGFTTIDGLSVLDGDVSQNDVYDEMGFLTDNFDDNLYNVVRIAAGCVVRLEHVHVKGGYAVETDTDKGGGIFNQGTLYLNHSTVSGNYCRNSAGGGGIFNNGNLSVSRCVFAGNHGYGDGGAVYCETDGFLQVEHSRFEHNKAKSGSAVFVKNAAYCHVSGSSFTDNQSETYGTVTFYNKNYKGSTVLVNNTIANNRLSGHRDGKSMLGGSGVYIYTAATSPFHLVNNTLSGNFCDARNTAGEVAEQLGGAVFVRTGTLQAYNNIIAGNYSKSGYGDLYKVSGASISEKHNLYTAAENINTALVSGNLSFSSRDNGFQTLPTLLAGTYSDGLFTPTTFVGETGTAVIPLLATRSNGWSIASIPYSYLEETGLNADLNNDGELSGYLQSDQRGVRRNTAGNACFGAYESVESAGIRNGCQTEAAGIAVRGKQITVYGYDNFDWQIYDVQGRLLQTGTHQQNAFPIQLENFNSGNYLLQVTVSGHHQTFKFIL